MTDIAVEGGDMTSLKRHGWVGLFSIFILLGGLVYWASTTEIAGAVVAQGTVVVEGNAKEVQHGDGGTIKQIFVRDGETVEDGQILATLYDAEVSASLAIVQNQLRQALVNEARLLAEIDAKPNLQFDDVLEQDIFSSDNSDILEIEKRAFLASATARANRVEQLNEQIIQIEQQIEGLVQQKSALDLQTEILEGELLGLEELFAADLIVLSRVNMLEKELLSRKGERGRVVASIAQAWAGIAETKLKIIQITNDFSAAALSQLKEVRVQIYQGRQQLAAALDRYSRMEIRAPQSGIVHQLILYTVGGVIAPGETLMLIVPQDEQLLVSSQVRPVDIDKIFAGQKVMLRLPSFDQRITPEIKGFVHVLPHHLLLQKIPYRKLPTWTFPLCELALRRFSTGDRYPKCSR